jgi:adenylate kinase family enzyme
VLRSAIVRRVSVAGTSGSGTSTLARQLADILGVPHLGLDVARFLAEARSEAGAAEVRPRRVPKARR